ncbi:hypothetical protein [Parvicella tangerina]|uniref:Uncharacterized protein n=1 Tax=Parvicella tangerina TaxID=2829795 RepID=A0A916JPG0_9FLAO|nr:hypothetical protein [Parvicella tangerina]CAG5084578.1 hypothetical protein CRYO30217_02509 [Parvicella tangerina]
MSNYTLSNISDFHSDEMTGNYLVLFGVDKIPPHIGYVQNQYYYSKSSQGVKRKFDFNKVISSINRKGLPTIVIELNGLSLDPDQFFIGSNLSKGESCLNPIKEMMGRSNEAIKEVKYLFDLLDLLLKEGYIQKVEHLNCEKFISNGSISLKKYTQEDIDKAILDAKRPC